MRLGWYLLLVRQCDVSSNGDRDAETDVQEVVQEVDVDDAIIPLKPKHRTETFIKKDQEVTWP